MAQIPLSFTYPSALWLLTLAPLFLFSMRHSLVRMSSVRRWAALALRLVVFGALVLALAGAQWVRFSDRLCVMFLLDGSDSVRADADGEVLQQIREAVATKRDKDLAGVLVFGENALAEALPSRELELEAIEAVPVRRRTNIAQAIRLAQALFPSDAEKRVVLFTDGNENAGRAEREARAAAANGVRIDVEPLARLTLSEALVEAVEAPRQEEVGRPFEIKATIESMEPGPAVVRLFRDNDFVGKRDVTLARGKNVFTFRHTEEKAGFHTYEVMIDTPRDGRPDNNRAATFVQIRGKSRTLVCGEDEDTRYLIAALRVEDMLVDSARLPPATLAEAQNYDAIFLVNVAAMNLSREQMSLLRAYERDTGGGFAMIGGEDSFGVGGYAKTPIEDILPVRMELADKRALPSMAMVMVIDKSGSMSGAVTVSETKLKLACAAAARAVELMSPRDRVGVVAFDDKAAWALPLQSVENKDEIVERVFAIGVGGGTNLYPALQAATEALEKEETQIKHIIALTDGHTKDGQWDQVVGRMRAGNVSLSTVAVGASADRALLERLARIGDGRFYSTTDPRNTPNIFSRETLRVQRSYVVEQQFTPSVERPHEILSGLRALPQLGGYINTETKERAETILQSSLLKSPAPILAAWRHGLGKSLAFTSDAKNKWAAEWVAWGGYNKFWSQAARWLMRANRPSALHGELTIDGGAGSIVVDAIDEKDGRYLNFLDLTANVITPEFETMKIGLRQIGPGRYRADFSAPSVGATIATVHGGDQEPVTVGRVVSYPEEYKEYEPNHYLARRIADVTGGAVSPPVGEWFTRRGPGLRRPKDIWPWLVALALLLFPVDVAARRLRLDRRQLSAAMSVIDRLVPFVQLDGRRAAADDLTAIAKARRQARRRIEAQRDAAGPEATPEAPSAVAPSTATQPVHKVQQVHPSPEAPGADAASKPDPDLYISDDLAKKLQRSKPAARREPPKKQKPETKSAPSPHDSTTNRLLEARRRARKDIADRSK